MPIVVRKSPKVMQLCICIDNFNAALAYHKAMIEKKQRLGELKFDVHT